MGALRFPGFGARLSLALATAGYVKPSGKLDVPAFIEKYGYDSRGFYPWVRGIRTPELDTLTRLAEQLHVTRAWLLLGDGEGPSLPRRKPSPMGSGATGTPRRPPKPGSLEGLCKVAARRSAARSGHLVHGAHRPRRAA